MGKRGKREKGKKRKKEKWEKYLCNNYVLNIISGYYNNNEH
jgi:hypothetical protein